MEVLLGHLDRERPYRMMHDDIMNLDKSRFSLGRRYAQMPREPSSQSVTQPLDLLDRHLLAPCATSPLSRLRDMTQTGFLSSECIDAKAKESVL